MTTPKPALPEPVALIDPRALARGDASLHCITRPEYRSIADADAGVEYVPVYTRAAIDAAVAEARAGLERECDDTDKLLRGLGLDPERCRTEGGALNVGKTLTLLAEARAVPILTAFDDAVAAEIQRVSHVEYDANEICKHFAGEVRKRLAATPSPAEQPKPAARNALQEAQRNHAEDAYFAPRPVQDGAMSRKAFCDGFDRGWRAALQGEPHDQA